MVFFEVCFDVIVAELGRGVEGVIDALEPELELRNLCEDVVCSQLLKRVASLNAVTCCCQEEDCEVSM